MTLLSCNHLIIFAFLGNLLSFFISWNVHFKWSEKEFIQFILNTVSWCIYLTSQSERNKFVVVVVVLNFQRVFRLRMRDCCIINSNASNLNELYPDFIITYYCKPSISVHIQCSCSALIVLIQFISRLAKFQPKPC